LPSRQKSRLLTASSKGPGPLSIRKTRSIAFAAAALALAVAGLVNAVDDASLTLERVGGDGWSAENIAIDWHLPDRASATIGRLQLSAGAQELRNVRIDCPRLQLSARVIACEGARVAAIWPQIGAQTLTAKLVYGRSDGSLEAAVSGIKLGDGTAKLAASLRGGTWTFDLSLAGVTLNNESGSLATDKLSARVRGTARQIAADWQFAVDVSSSQGQAYAQPIFLDFGAHALRASAAGKLRGDRALTIERFTLDHAQVAQASGSTALDFTSEQPLRSLTVRLAALEFPGAYESYLQPLLLDTNFKAMQTVGKLAGQIEMVDGAPTRVDLALDDLTFDAGGRTVALQSLAGAVHWRADPQQQSEDSVLRWSGGALLGLALGASELQFNSSARQFRLLQPTRIPLLDGALALESLRIRNAGLPSVAFMVDATLEPVDVKQLCRTFGWPEFGGRVGGTISKLRMREGVVTLGTTLSAQVFDGSVTFSDLLLQQPLGKWPKFSSNVAFENLDLELMTGAFSFGRITGRLSGRVDGLRLFNWAPVAFDARLYTPPGDRSKHRISQRAVENIGSIGGGGAGVTAALSSGFLRFFDDFNYERLGLSCRLENNVCAMNGVAPAPNGGYYLVKGKGLPRIDVIGSSHRVDWPRLVQQLIAATKSGGPTVQ
jgi:hypothetical protein